MKTPKALVLGSMILMSVIYACKKNDAAPESGKTDNKWSGETMKVKLKFNGDFQTEESPLGRQMSNARINPDSVIYAVDVRWADYKPFAQGIFTRLDSLNLDLPKGAFFKIRVAAIKKGSGLGLYELNDTLNNTRFLPGTPLGRYITNRLSTDSAGPNALTYGFLDTISGFWVATRTSYEIYRYSELDSYYGFYQGAPQDSQQASITIPLKRITYGIRFKPQNFTEGRLMVDYQYLSSGKSLTFNHTYDTVYTYTAHEFTYTDALTYGIPVALKWYHTNGSIQNLGSVTIYPKRNTLTTLSVTAPSTGIPLGISIAESNWRTDTTVVVR